MARRALRVRVECEGQTAAGLCGTASESHPARFFFGRRQVKAVDVIDRWLAQDHRYFKLRGDDNGTYILRHDLPTNCWELTLYSSHRVAGDLHEGFDTRSDRDVAVASASHVV